MKRLFTFLFSLIIASSFCSIAQNIPSKQDLDLQREAFTVGNNILRSLQNNRDYIRVLNELLAHPEYFDSPNYLDILAWVFTYAGHDFKGIEFGDKAFPKTQKKTEFNPGDYEIIDALEYIGNISRDYQIVMVNEEHRMPKHRVLTQNLLRPLFENGYRYLLVETLTQDSTLMLTGEPILNSGHYSKDPVFGELLRQAHDIGYTILPYEMVGVPDNYGKLPPMERQILREETQADNIIDKVLAENPDAKLLVHAGRGHNAEIYETMEGSNSIFAMMAGILKHKTGIDPLTIDQLQHEEHSDVEFESSVAAWIRNKPGILIYQNCLLREKEGGEILSKESYDISIVSPVTQYVENRPSWLVNDNQRSALSIDIKEFQPQENKYFMVQAIFDEEDHNISVPADQYAYDNSIMKASLYLRAGSYVIRILDDRGEVLKQWIELIN